MPNDMRDRLIELIKECDKRESDIMFKEKRAMSFDEWCGLYADCLIENGAILPPCKVGDTLYDISEFVNGCSYPEIYEYTCEYITIFKDKDGETVFEIDAINFRFNDFGKTVFLTREDAEKALGERE